MSPPRPHTPGRGRDRVLLSPILEDSDPMNRYCAGQGAGAGAEAEAGQSSRTRALTLAEISLTMAIQNMDLRIKPEPAKMDEPPKETPSRSKPRLLLMGQRR